MALEHHKELFEHWSDEEYVSSSDNDEYYDDFYEQHQESNAKYYEMNGNITLRSGRTYENESISNLRSQDRTLLFV